MQSFYYEILINTTIYNIKALKQEITFCTLSRIRAEHEYE